MKKFIGIIAIAGIAIFTAACSGSSSGSGGTKVDTQAQLRADCSSRADSFDTAATGLSARADAVSPLDESAVRSLISDGRTLVSEGRSIVSDCGSLISSSQKAQLSSALDEAESGLDTLDRIYGN